MTKKHFVHHLHNGSVGNVKMDPTHFAETNVNLAAAERRFTLNEYLPETDFTPDDSRGFLSVLAKSRGESSMPQVHRNRDNTGYLGKSATVHDVSAVGNNRR